MYGLLRNVKFTVIFASDVWPQRPNIPQRQMLRPKGPPTLDVYQEQQKAAELQTPPQPTKPKFKETLLVIKPYQQQTRGEPINRLMFANMRFVLTSATRAKDATGSEAGKKIKIECFLMQFLVVFQYCFFIRRKSACYCV